MSSISASSSSSRPSRYTRRGRRRLLWVICAALLGVASLIGKAGYYSGEVNAHPERGDARRVQKLLIGSGWILSGSTELVSGGAPVLLFRVPGCTGFVRVGVLPSNGEMASLFSEAAGPDARVFYTYRGRIAGSPPRFAYLHAKVADLMRTLGFRPRAGSSVIAVSQPQDCRLEAAVPWSEL